MSSLLLNINDTLLEFFFFETFVFYMDEEIFLSPNTLFFFLFDHFSCCTQDSNLRGLRPMDF